MSDVLHPRVPPEPGEVAEPLGRGIAAVVLTGVVLGLGFNYLGRQGPEPHRGLPWISKPVLLDSVESLAAPVTPLPSVVTEPAPAPVSAPAPAAPANAPAPARQAKPEPEPKPRTEAEANGPPDVPDVGRPLQVQLPAVKKFWDAKAALIVDAREPAEYAAGHIPGAVNVPYDEAVGDPARLDAVESGGRPIICYCGGGSCEVSIHLAEALVYQAGKKRVLVFMGGFPDWESAGYPVEK